MYFRELLPKPVKAAPNSYTKATEHRRPNSRRRPHAQSSKSASTRASPAVFTTREIYEAVPEIKEAYATPNALALAWEPESRAPGWGCTLNRARSLAAARTPPLRLPTSPTRRSAIWRRNWATTEPEALAEAITTLPMI